MKFSILVLLLTASRLQSALYCDEWISLSNQTVGATATITVMNNGTLGQARWFNVAGTAASLLIQDHQIDRSSTMVWANTNQPAGQYQRSMSLSNISNFTYWELSTFPSGKPKMQAFGWINPGPTNKPTGGDLYDLLGLYGDITGYVIMQLKNGNPYAIRIETDGAGTLHSADISVSTNTWYWFILRADYSGGTAELWIYDQTGTQLGDVTCAQLASSSTINLSRVGNAESGVSSGITYWQDIAYDWTLVNYRPLPFGDFITSPSGPGRSRKPR